ncbi:MAG: hypothetical protein HYR85_17350 [Planctomycetes bacterium]|nr:hypothetical protein [Planctomycetota bacterium]MBI3843428.1 hypothetical protein [Planctomycetota bacterium]
MKLPTMMLLTFAALAAISNASSAQAERVVLRDGRAVDGKVLDVNEREVAIELVVGGSPARTAFSREEIEPHAYYALARSRIQPTNARARLALARYCADHGLLSQARMEAESAVAHDRSLEVEASAILDDVDRKLPDALLDWARSLAAKHDAAGARMQLDRLVTRYPDSRAAADAQSLLEQISVDETAAMARERDRKMARLENATAQRVAAQLDPIVKLAQRAADFDRRGLQSAAKQNQALGLFEQSVSTGRDALSKIEQLKREHAERPAVVEALDELDREVRGQVVQSYLNVSSIHVARRAFPRALEATAAALDVAPKDLAVLAERTRIEVAQANASWGRGASGRR